MEPTYFAQYRGFEFQCSPARVGEHAFAPRLVIFDIAESLTLEIPLGVPTPIFNDPTAAAHQAFAHGRRWVDSGYSSAERAAAVESTPTQSPPTLLPG